MKEKRFLIEEKFKSTDAKIRKDEIRKILLQIIKIDGGYRSNTERPYSLRIRQAKKR